jgi:8-amino-7-oxononanoate synthase
MGIRDRITAVSEIAESLKGAGRDPSSLVIESITSPAEAMIEGRETLLLGTNNYLGLTFEPSCVEAASFASQQQGAGTTGSRIANGSYAGHTALEQQIAEFYAKKSAMVFSTG